MHSCEFGTFFQSTPADLIDSGLYRKIAVAFTTVTVWALSLQVQTLGVLPHAVPQLTLPTLPTSGWGSLLSTVLVMFALSSLASIMSGSAVANLGVRPTFDGGRFLVEVHLLDFRGDLYGRQLEVAFVDRLRAEQRFADSGALVAQIRSDALEAAAVLKAHPAS